MTSKPTIGLVFDRVSHRSLASPGRSELDLSRVCSRPHLAPYISGERETEFAKSISTEPTADSQQFCPRGPLKGSRAPLKGPRGPLKGPRGPLKGSRSPSKRPRGPFKGHRDPFLLKDPGVPLKDPGIL